MTTDRCPSCRGAVRAGDPWCTLCWTDLRPKPEPVPEPVAVAPVGVPGVPGVPGLPGLPGVPVVGSVAQAVAAPVVDPLTAPLGALLGQPVAGDPAAPPAVTWPCVECGSQNAIELNACSVCTAPFGGRITRLDDPKGARRRYMLMALGAVAVFLMMLAVVTFAATNSSTGDADGVPGDDPFVPALDFSQLPEG